MIERMRSLGPMEFTVLGKKLAGGYLFYLRGHDLAVDHRGEAHHHDLALTCSDPHAYFRVASEENHEPFIGKEVTRAKVLVKLIPNFDNRLEFSPTIFPMKNMSSSRPATQA